MYMPIGPGGEVLRPQCEWEGAALAAEEDDDHPRPPACGAMQPDFPHFEALATWLLASCAKRSASRTRGRRSSGYTTTGSGRRS